MKINEIGLEDISSNCIHISGGIYAVKNCSGFNNALYHYIREMVGSTHYSRKEIRGMVNSYPVEYPCLIALSHDLFERSVIFVDKAKPGLFDAAAHYYSSFIREC